MAVPTQLPRGPLALRLNEKTFIRTELREICDAQYDAFLSDLVRKIRKESI
jgi:hypothetical protein